MTSLEKLLFEFRDSHNLKGKGQLAVMLHITRLAIENGLPLNLETLRTEKEGQVAGLGKGRIQSILKDYGITRVLAEEGGRTSRGSLGNASDYSSFLNGLHKGGAVDLPSIEKWWVVRVQDYFSGKPFTLKFDPSKSLRSIVGDLLAQAKKRQDETRHDLCRNRFTAPRWRQTRPNFAGRKKSRPPWSQRCRQSDLTGWRLCSG